MNSLKTTFLTALMVLGFANIASAVGPCSAAQWSAADKSCAQVNGSGSCATSCQAITAHTAIVGCEGGGMIVIDTSSLEADVQLEREDKGTGTGEVIKDFSDIRIETKATKVK